MPWSPEGRALPTVADLRQSIDVLTIAPTEPKHMAWCLAKLQISFESHLPKPSAEATKMRIAVWAEANADLGNDLWSKATLHCIRNSKYGMPKPPDFRRAVIEEFTTRQQKLDRCRRMMAIHGERIEGDKRAANQPFQPEPEEVKLRATIRRFLDGNVGSFLRPMLQRSAIAAEKRLAEIEGREPADWIREGINASPTEAPKPIDTKLPPVSAASQAALHRAIAKRHREQGNARRAEMLEREADVLAPLYVDEPVGDEQGEAA